MYIHIHEQYMYLLLSMSSLILVIQNGMFHCAPPELGVGEAASRVSDEHTLINSFLFDTASGTLRTKPG